MRILKCTLPALAILTLVCINQVHAGSRRGFIARFDLGGAVISTTAENPAWHNPEYSISKGGAGTVIALGYAPNDYVVIHGSLRNIYYGEHAPLAILMGPAGMLIEDGNLLMLVGVSYYFRRGIPSWFIEAGVGGGVIGNPFGDRLLSNLDQDGLAFFAGVGYEFLRHYHFEVQFLWMRSDTGLQSREGRWTSATLMATVGVMIY